MNAERKEGVGAAKAASPWSDLTAAMAAALSGPGAGVFLPLALLLYLSARGTVYVWWSSSDTTGLFMVGIMMLALPVLAGTFLFVGGAGW